MVNLMAFLSSFASYLFVFLVFIAAITVAVLIGVFARKLVDKSKKGNDKTENQKV